MELSCPKCNSANLRRSHTRGIKERFFKRLGRVAFRCREKDCRWRGLIQIEPTQEIFKQFMTHNKAALIGLGIMMGIVIVLVPLLLFFGD